MSDSSPNLYRVTPRQCRTLIEDALFAGLVPFVQSSPGVGKSSIMHQISHALSLALIDHRLSTSDPTDLSGLPHFVDGMARFAPFTELFPLTTTPIPKEKEGWMVFFDEFNSAKKDVMAAAYKTILDKKVGQHKLHERVVMCAAGNLETDRAIVNNLSTAMQSRLIHLELEVNFKEWLEDVALKENYDARIIAFLSRYPGKLMDFRPDHNNKTFCCPRTWEFMNRLIKGKTFNLNKVIENGVQIDRYEMDTKAPLYTGTITPGTAVEFIQFTRVFHNLITVRQILADPENCAISGDPNINWAVISHMMENVNDDTFGGLSTYANRFTTEFRILFFRSAMVRHPHMRQHPAFAKAMSELTRYLHD